MSQLLISITAFLVAIVLLIVVHEFGHFWVARKCGIKVLRFSIGFGRSLYHWYDRLGTEYVISLIPLGGYVSLFGERGQEVSTTERHMAFTYKPVLIRMLVLLAGPAFNLLFAIFLYWIVFLMKVTVLVPILGDVPKDSPADIAGLHPGEEIVSVEGKPTPSWEAVSLQLLAHMGEDKIVRLTLRDPAKNTLETKNLDLGNLLDDQPETNWLETLGLAVMDPVPPIIGKVLPDYPAFKAGIKEQDRIEKVDGKKVYSRDDVVRYIQAHPNQPIILEIKRAEKKLNITVIPLAKQTENIKQDIGFIGIEFPALKELPTDFIRTQQYGIGEALIKAVKRTTEYSILTLEILQKMIIGKVSVRHINGPLVIAKYAGETVAIGFKHFLNFLAMISISLGVLNLLPIPILDGGHFMYCVYEFLTGRRISEVAQTIGIWIGGAILVVFMILAFYNDLTHLLR